ncbi:hypothetical protein [Metaplanococcus flavidus]|uniref:Uncharacterized protein n=1 Tax=Metaplanococcus flavidus TaxID=569883 RepID=A0ABW3L8E2_9BACL
MTDKKEPNREEEEKEDSFTGSPEEQFPDLEAEDTHDPKKIAEEKDSDKDKEN